ncbi:hypothetical protein EJB05_03143, partial [Eragrostis curvula]
MSYSQVTQFQTKSTKLFDGPPKNCFLYLVAKMLLRDSGTNVATMVNSSEVIMAPLDKNRTWERRRLGELDEFVSLHPSPQKAAARARKLFSQPVRMDGSPDKKS